MKTGLLLLSVIISFVINGCIENQEESKIGDLQQEIVSEKDEAVMVLVPAGNFLMGTSDDDMKLYRKIFPLRRDSRFDNERPQHTVYLDAFYIDKFEVTNSRYLKFLNETGYQASSYLDFPLHNRSNFPAIVGKWQDAYEYAKWAGKRLPTEAEWEKAARGTDGWIWPWGNKWDASKLNANDGNGEIDGYAQTAPVGQYPESASPYGAYDMAGNVWEWVADWYSPDYYKISPSSNPQGPKSGKYHVLRGGSWADNNDFTRCASRFGITDPGSLLSGFRCVLKELDADNTDSR